MSRPNCLHSSIPENKRELRRRQHERTFGQGHNRVGHSSLLKNCGAAQPLGAED